MFARITPNYSGRDRRVAQGSGQWLLRVVLVLATLSLSTLVTVEASQACTSKTSIAAIVKQRLHDLKQTAKPRLVVSRAAVVSINNTHYRPHCCQNRLGHCLGSFCGGACCISAVLAAEGSASWDAALRLEFPSSQHPPTSSKLDIQFPPPRTAL